MSNSSASLRRLFRGGAAFGALTLAASAAWAQTAPQPPADPAAEEQSSEDVVVITGSRILRDATNAPAPVIQIGQEELLSSGEPNLVDFLADVPALSGSTVPEDTTGSNLNDGGLALLNLRDLGSVRTLVLVDGRRHVGAPQGSLSVDVDTIPSLLIDSVEIVTGGQSALYGADAVSGVVNFIMKKDFEGLEVDATYAQINQDGQANKRISALAGHNFLDDRLNVYAFGEYQEGDEVRDSDIDWRSEAWSLLNYDTDPASAPADDQIDNILIRNARDAYFVRGGLIMLADQVQPSALNDPDNVLQACGNVASNTFVSNISGNSGCFNHGPELGNAWVFDGAGSARLFNYGTFQDQNGTNRRINIGGDGLNIGTEFGQGSRIPSTVNERYQAGFNYAFLDNVSAFGEYKYVEEETFDEGQPTFFQGGIGQPVANQTASIFSSANFNVGLDNPYLPANLVAAISGNVRPTYGAATATAPGAQTGTVADSRATFNMFGPVRDQLNNREVERAVLGFRGDVDTLFGVVNDVNWEVGYTYGESRNNNREHGVDIIRFAYSADAVVDTAGVLGTPGAVVCRGTLLNAQGVQVRDQWNGGFHAANDPVLTECRPTNIFGVDLRDSSTEAAGRAYWDAAINVTHKNVQQDWMAFASGKLWDFWGAGPIGVAVGAESRKEKTYGQGRSTETGNRFLFLNTGPDFATAGYSVDEYFGEVQIPLLKDMFLAEYAEIDAAYRKSDYTTVGEQEVWNVTANYRPVDEFLLRASYGTSIRVPTLSENFGPATQTFANGFVDPCDSTALSNFTATNPTLGANRRANCISLLGPNYNPDTTQILYPSGVPGFNAGNPFLEPEESRSYTISAVWTPSFLENTSFVLDWYDIKITNVIASVTAQQAANQCVNDSSLNTAACATITRNGFIGAGDPNNFRMSSFIQGSLNYAATLAKGIDFAATTGFNFKETFGFDAGDIAFRLRGNYLIRQTDFVNISDPSAATHFDGGVGLPRVRYLFTTTWSPIDELRISWDMDWQAEQEILDDSVFLTNTDTRLREYANTTDFIQHDLTVSYDVWENLRLRAGVVNIFDAEPDRWLGSTTTADNFDFWGTRFFVGLNYKY